MTNKGYSPFQIVFGSNPKVPGITYSNPASLSETFVSSDIKAHIQRVHNARISYRLADNDERIKRALKAKIDTSGDVYEKGNEVWYWRGGKWRGPATVMF